MAKADEFVALRDGACCKPQDHRHLRAVAMYDIDGPEGEAWCAAACTADPRCRFFTFAGGRIPNRCDLCSSCTLSPSASTRSWPRGWHGCARRSIPSLIGELLGEHLQNSYSRLLYGRPGMVRLQELRVIFADLLPRGALRAMAAVGVCKAEASPPFNPFYWGHDVYANPRNSIWVHRTYGPQPLGNDTWVEISHCALTSGLRGGSGYPLWAYAAPGSGISMNVGRTMIAASYNHATWLLRQAFPKHTVNAMLANTEVEAALSASPLAGLDSLQIVNHREYHTIEARHEIIFLHQREHDLLTIHTPGVMCGRHPQLFACSERNLAHMTNCSSRPTTSVDSTHWLQAEANVRKLFRSHRRCNVSHTAAPSKCYSEHVERWGEYHCCGTNRIGIGALETSNIQGST